MADDRCEACGKEVATRECGHGLLCDGCDAEVHGSKNGQCLVEPSMEQDRRRPPLRMLATALLLSLTYIGAVRADELPTAPIPNGTVIVKLNQPPRIMRERVADRKFWTMVGILGAAKAADLVTTQRLLNRGGYETDPIYGRHPSSARLAAVTAGYFGAEVVGAWLLKRYGRHHRWAQVLWLGEPAFQTQEHVRFAIHNEHQR